MNRSPASRLDARAKALAKPNPITGVDGDVQGIEAHVYLTFENATRENLDKLTLKECLDNMSYGHAIPMLFEHNKKAVLGHWTKLFRSSEQPYAHLREKRLLLDGVAVFHPESQVSDKDLYRKVQDDIRRGALLRVSIGARNTSARKVISEISLVVSGKEPLAKMYKLLFSEETGKKEARLRSNVYDQVMATESAPVNDKLKQWIDKAGGEEQLAKALEAYTAYSENKTKKYSERVQRDLKTHKQRLIEANPENDYAKPLLEFYANSLKDPSTKPTLKALGRMSEDIEKIHKAKLALEAADKTKTEEWTATNSKMQAELEAARAELAKAQEQVAKFQGSAQDAAKGKRTSPETVSKPVVQQTPQPSVAMPAMPWSSQMHAIEVKQSNPFLSDLWGNNRQGTAKDSAEVFQATIQDFLAKLPK